MLTRRHEHVFIDNETAPSRRIPAILVAAVLFGVVASATYRTPGLPTGPVAP